MKKCLFSIKDELVGVFNNPCVFPSIPAAVRAFGDMVENDKDGFISKHPSDYSLYYIAEFDAEKGVIDYDYSKVQKVASGSDFIK